jgi:hypothetical protein
VQGHTATLGGQNFAYLDFLDCQRQSRSLNPMAGWLYDWGTLSEPGEPENVELREVTSNLFPVLGVPVFRGHGFLEEEDHPGGPLVAVIGYSLWQRRFAGSPDTIGRSLVLNGKRYTVVGIAPATLRLDGEPDVLTALGQDTAGYLQNRRAHPVGVLARLHPEATVAQAQSEFAVLGRQLAAQYPDTNSGRSFVVEPLRRLRASGNWRCAWRWEPPTAGWCVSA